MGASNWARCPRCVDVATQMAEQAATEARALYGQVSVEDFDAARAKVPTVADLTDTQPTLREDYETYGAETGTVTYVYRGRCSKCDLSVERRDEHTFYVRDAGDVPGRPT